MDSEGMDTGLFFNSLRANSLEQGNMREARFEIPGIKDSNIPDDPDQLNLVGIAKGEFTAAFYRSFQETEQKPIISTGYNNDYCPSIQESCRSGPKAHDTVELFVKKSEFEPRAYAGRVPPTASEIRQPAQRATEILTPKRKADYSAALDLKSCGKVASKEQPSQSLGVAAMKKPIPPRGARLDIWKVLTILNTVILIEMLALCLSR